MSKESQRGTRFHYRYHDDASGLSAGVFLEIGVSAAGIPQVVGCGAGVIPQVSRRSYPAGVGW